LHGAKKKLGMLCELQNSVILEILVEIQSSTDDRLAERHCKFSVGVKKINKRTKKYFVSV